MKPEILAPAGSMEALKAAVHAGADAVYLGGDKFGARAYADNFNQNTLIEAIEYSHLYGVKVYLTINTLFRNEELQQLAKYLEPFYNAGLDAVIVQDFGVMKFVHTYFPDLPIHASTQMTITTGYAYSLLQEYGVTRIVPARELSIEEIASLKINEPAPEIEVFVQGALCYCYSGQCLMSSMLGGRSGNRGRCAQTCRLPYTIQDEEGRAIKTKGDYLLSPKDLCGLESIPDLIKAGVDSFKIEGRMKKPEYVAACVRAYRRLVDAWYADEFSDHLIHQYKEEMAEVFNRGGFTEGYYHQKNGKQMMSVKQPGNVGVDIGKIVAVKKNQISIRLEKDVYKGDLLVPAQNEVSVTLTNNIDGKKGQTIVLNAPKAQKLYNGQNIKRMSKAPLMEALGQYITQQSEVSLKGNLQLYIGEPARFSLEIELKGKRHTYVYEGEVVEKASSKPLTEETVRDKIGKTGNTRYQFDELTIQMSEDAFYPLKALKDLRRNAIALLENCILDESRRVQNSNNDLKDSGFEMQWEMVHGMKKTSGQTQETVVKNSGKEEIVPVSTKNHNVVMVSSVAQYQIVREYKECDAIYLDMQYFDNDELVAIIEQNLSQKLVVALPPVLRMHYLKDIEHMVSFILKQKEQIGIMIRNIDELALLKHYGFDGDVVTDYSLYAMNDWAAAFIKTVIPDAVITIPVELNAHQMKTLSYISGNSAIEVYGYQQLMVSAQCLQNTTDRCNHAGTQFVMQDRYLKNFFVFTICKYCYNVIYNGLPTVLYDVVDGTIGDHVARRIHFTKESQEEVSNVLATYFKGKSLQGEKTRGHYRRGVE